MEEHTMESGESNTARAEGVASQVNGNSIEFGPGLAGTVSAQENLSMSRSAALMVRAGGDMGIENSGAVAFVAGSNLHLANGGGQVMVAGGNMELTNGGAEVVIAGGNVTMRKGFILAVISSQVSLEEGSRVLLNTPQAIAFGVAVGAVMGLMKWLLPRRKGRGYLRGR